MIHTKDDWRKSSDMGNCRKRQPVVEKKGK
jgi:hypothetical protein